MMSSSVPASALNWRTASRRLPLTGAPCAKVVGVIVVGTQRDSKGSIDNRVRPRCLLLDEPNWESRGKEIAFTNCDLCHAIENPPMFEPRRIASETTAIDHFPA